MTEAPEEDGYRRGRPGVPTGVVVAAVLIALLVVSGLLLLLYRETRGPGEILREFARAVDDGDCGASYDLLDVSVQAELVESRWCEELLPAVDGQLDADFDLEQAVLEGDQALVEVTGVRAVTWRLRRFGERSWRIVGPEGGFPDTGT
jgi:hypothetical protein